MSRHFLTSAIWLLPLVATVPLFAQPRHDHGPAKHTVGAAPVPVKLHVRLTTLRPRSPGDSVRAKRLTRAVRNSIGRYADVRAAERDGYRLLFAGDTSAGQVLHYSHIWRGVMEGRRLDPVQPGSLLYEKQRDGTLRLVGAMYTASDKSTPAQLDARVPLSYAVWHLHTDICVPRPVWDGDKWARKLAGGHPAFGPESPIATRAACTEIGGEFKPNVFG